MPYARPISLLVFLTLAGCRAASASPPAAERAPERIAIRVADVERAPIARPVRGTGIVRLKSEVDLSFKVGGVVSAVLVEEGARVRKGQLLARLDPTEVDAALRQAKEGVTKAERDLERVRRLHASGSLPVAELENAETGASLAKAAADAASFNAQRAAIVAPDDGRVDRRMIEPGEVVAPGRPVFHVSGRSKGAVVRVGLTDRDVLRVRLGDPASVVLDARPGEAIRGQVDQIATVATPGAGTFEVEIKLDAPADALLSGLTAKVEIAHEEAGLAAVPVSAIVDGRGDDAAVFVLAGDRVRRVPVKVGFLDGGKAALRSGLAEERDARVVASGAGDLVDGALVRVLP